MPAGSVEPLSEMVGSVGPLVVVTVNDECVPAVAEVLAALVMATPSGTVTVEEFEVTGSDWGSLAVAVAVFDTEPSPTSIEVVL
jgi:hypothetical protein